MTQHISLHVATLATLLRALAPKPEHVSGAEQVRAELTNRLDGMRGYAIALAGQCAGDLLQTTALNALTHADQFQKGTNLGAWLYMIMKNAHYTERRRLALKGTTDYADVPENLLGLRGNQEDAAYLSEVDEAMLCLSPAQADVLRGIAVGLSYGDVATDSGVSIGTVKSRLWRARTHLKELVA